MPGVPINSLKDLLMLREIKQQSDPTFSALEALGQGVAAGIEQQREEAKARKQIEERNEQALKRFASADNSNRGRMIPRLKQKADGTLEFTASTPTLAEKKIIREQEQLDSFREGVMSGSSSTELGRRFPGMAGEIAELEEIGVLSPAQSSGVEPSLQNTAAGQSLVGGDSIVTERTAQGRPKKVISESGKITEAQIGAIGKVQEGQTKDAVKSIASFNRVKQASSGMVAAAKRMIKEQGGFGLIPVVKGKIKRTMAKTGLTKTKPEDAQAGAAELRGQTREMVLALSPILTNQNRVIQGVIDMLSETIPQPGIPTTGTEFTAQLKQTTKNSYRLSKALAAGALTAGEIKDLNASGDIDTIRSTMKSVLNRASWTKQDEEDFKDQWSEISATPATQAETIFNIDGKEPLIIQSVEEVR